MSLKSYLSSLPPEQREHFARRAGTTVGHLRNCAYGSSPVNPGLASTIERLTKGLVTRQELRPNDWRVIWPELTRKRGARGGSFVGRASHGT